MPVKKIASKQKASKRMEAKNRNFAKMYGTKKKKATKPRTIDTKAVTGTIIPKTEDEVEVLRCEDSIIVGVLHDIFQRDGEKSNVDIRIEIGPSEVTLYVGPRDWQWNRGNGMLTGSGTTVELAQEEVEVTETPNPANTSSEG